MIKPVIASLVLLAFVSFAAVEISGSEVTFTYKAPETNRVYLAGDFNGWSETANPMEFVDSVWTITLTLKPKRYEYKFFVDGEYFEDPGNPKTNSDPYGGVNSVVVVPPEGGEFQPPEKPGEENTGIPIQSEREETVFTYIDPDASSVYLAGDFNDWSTDATSLTEAESGIWRVALELDPGKYEYKFFVDGDWKNDPENPERVPDPYGGENSVITVPAPGEKGPTEYVETEPEKRAQAPSAQKTGEKGVTFEYYNPSARQVFIAGDFNSWSPDADPLESDEEGNWTITLDLAPGKYQYKFVVDGSWQPDPDNPRTESDGYGGINSVVEIDEEGNIVVPEIESLVERVSNTFANSRVYIGGKYTGIVLSRWDREGDRRFHLFKPRHRLESYIRVKISNDVSAWGSMNIDTKDADRIYEAALSLDSAAVELYAGNFTGQIYYNRPVGGLDDPLDIIEPAEVAGALDFDVPFGLGTGGVKAHLDLYGASLTGLYCDRFDSWNTTPPAGALTDGIIRFNMTPFMDELISPTRDPDEYTEFGTDILGLRISRPIGPVTLGATMRRDAGTWWYQKAELDSSGDYIPDLFLPELDAWTDSTESESDWFALGKSEMFYGGDLALSIGIFGLWGEYLIYDYKGGVVAGNKENDARDGNGPIDLDVGKWSGHESGGELNINPLDFLDIGFGYKCQLFTSPEEDGLYLLPLPSTDGDGFIDMSYGTLQTDMGSVWHEEYYFKAELDRFVDLSAKFGMEKYRDESSSFDGLTFDGSIAGSVIWEFISYDFAVDWASAGFHENSKQSEFLADFNLTLAVSDKWYFILDGAYHTAKIEYNGSPVYDHKAFPVYTGLQYCPVDNVRMELFWGYHPKMANGWPAARREYIDEAIRETGVSYFKAWEDLEEIRQIGIRGEIDF